MVDFVLEELVIFDPNSLFEEADLCFIELSVLYGKPAFAASLHLINDLEEGALLEKAVAYVKLYFGQNLEELKMIYLWRTG